MVLAVFLGAACHEAYPPAVSEPTEGGSNPSPEILAFERKDLAVERALDPGERHIYRLSLAAGAFLHIEIDQRGSDVYAQLLDPAGRVLLKVDSHSGDRAPEHLSLVLAESGSHELVIGAFESNPRRGAYRAHIVRERLATSRDHRYAAAEKAFAVAFSEPAQVSRSSVNERVKAGFEKALATWRDLGERSRQAASLYELAFLHHQAGLEREAIPYYEQSLPLLTKPEDRWDRAFAVAEIARAKEQLGEPRAAESGFREALGLFRELGTVPEEARVLASLGRLVRRRGRPLEALNLLRQSEEHWRRFGERQPLAETLNMVGEVYGELGELELALDHHRQALELLDGRVEPLQRATTLGFIGRTLLRGDDLGAASTAYLEALRLREESRDLPGQAAVWAGLGLLEERRGNSAQALELYLRALTVYEQRQMALERATVLNNIAWVYNRLGEAEVALGWHGRSLDLFRRLENHQGQATARLGLAKADHQLGRSADALGEMEAALELVEWVLESGQVPAVRQDLSLPFLSSHQKYFEFYIELLMAEHRRRPTSGFDALAFAASERSRARNLLELLEMGGRPPWETKDAKMVQELANLKAEIDHADRDLRAEKESGAGLAERRVGERHQRLRLIELRRLLYHLQKQDLGRTFSPQPRRQLLNSLESLLDGETLFLEFHLGAERSYVWAVTQGGLTSYELPSKRLIEDQARRAYELLVESDRLTHRVPTERALAELSSMVLGPLAGELTGQRLAIVAGGALESIPFAVLPQPGNAQRPLVADHEIIRLPSAAVLSILRNRGARRGPPEGLVAILADPVFDETDERLEVSTAESSAPESAEASLRRLLHSRREADQIHDVALGHGPVLLAVGFDANRDLVLSGRLADFRILHFATHGVLHADHPELSALMLSSFDAEGRRREGRLPLYAINELNLPADLVVLSACRSALGKPARGEGLLGLPRGFLYAGASRVLVSLWNVRDESTAELMARFYHHLLEEDRTPPAALRLAQLSMLDEPRYAPYHWAPFVLQGDWR